jgi:hypothetical protein
MSIIYKQFNKYAPLSKLDGLQWFALYENYGQSYGDIHIKYKFKKKPNLLDIGNAYIREEIEKQIKPFNQLIIKYNNPDEQYSGSNSNKIYHNILKSFYYDNYDGTIIDSNNLFPNVKYSIDDLDGPSEIVLWKDIPKILEEIKDEGKRKSVKRKRRKKSKRK